MKAPLIKNQFNNSAGRSALDLIILIAMISAIAGFVLVNYFREHRAVIRTKTTTDFANHLQKARLDSMRRRVTDTKQMAQVKVFNRKFYSVALDGDGDGNLDAPLVLTVPAEEDVAITGPFPKTYMFDSRGLTVDWQNHPITPEPITVSNSAGVSAITFSETGNITVVAGLGPQSRSAKNESSKLTIR
jgi:type II secretory pathway pseudopilin PulG